MCRRNVRWQVGDATELQLPAGCADVVFSNWLLMYLSDAEVSKLAGDALTWVPFLSLLSHESRINVEILGSCTSGLWIVRFKVLSLPCVMSRDLISVCGGQWLSTSFP